MQDELKQLLLSVTANKTSPAMIERIVNMHMNSGDKDGDGQIVNFIQIRKINSF